MWRSGATPDTPSQLPVIDAGRHLPGPDGCLMEITSLVAGERWSDSPRCTHPLLATVARMANDGCSARRRPQLLRFVADLATTPGTAPASGAAVVLVCARAAIGVGVVKRSIRRHLRRAAGRLTRRTNADGSGVMARLADRLYTHGSGRLAVCRAVNAVADASVCGRDERLVGLLEECIRVCQDPLSAGSRRPAAVRFAPACPELPKSARRGIERPSVVNQTATQSA